VEFWQVFQIFGNQSWYLIGGKRLAAGAVVQITIPLEMVAVVEVLALSAFCLKPGQFAIINSSFSQ
jgi:hypothetical protein